MEKEFGISCSASVPKEQYPEDMLYLDKKEPAATNALQNQQEEEQMAQNSTNPSEEEKNKVVGLCF